MSPGASDVARRLARQAEAVCRHYLPAGRREGAYWRVGDVANRPGQSLYVRLAGPKAGKWADAATGEHGDLLDLIALNQGHDRLADTLSEARRFLSIPRPASDFDQHDPPAPRGSRKAAARLFAASRSIAATTAEAYLRGRAVTGMRSERWLRFHPNCWYRPDEDDAPGTPQAFPALIAAVTDNHGTITGIHRTFLAPQLDPATRGKAPIATPRRSMGDLLGHGVRFGAAGHVMAAGEGLETVLSLRMSMRTLPAIACLSSSHLAAINWPEPLRRLYVVRDPDPAGDGAWAALAERGARDGIAILPLQTPLGSDFNDALLSIGASGLATALAEQLMPADAARFLMT